MESTTVILRDALTPLKDKIRTVTQLSSDVNALYKVGWSRRVDALTDQLTNKSLKTFQDLLEIAQEVEEEEGISGGWHVFIRIALHCLVQIENNLLALPKVGKKEEAGYITRMDVGIDINRFLSNVAPFAGHLTHILEILSMIIKSQSKEIDWTMEKIKEECSACTIPPFWYSYEEGLGNLQQLLETVKHAAASAASASEPHRVGKDSPLFSLAFGGAKAMINKVTEDDHQAFMRRLNQDTNIHVLKTLWSLPEDKVLRTFISIGFPSILLSITANVPRPDEEGGPISCQFISSTPFTFKIPKEAVDIEHNSPSDVITKDEGKPVRVLLHFHGGGFIAGCPHTHEPYLREWAQDSNCLIVSVDYKLAPEKHYPYQVDECSYVYKWLMENNPWGIKPSVIAISGDSAGGNLTMAATLNILTNFPDLPPPDGLLMSYPALNLTHTISPSRIMFINDVLVPYFFLDICLNAYLKGADPEDPHVSPAFASDEVLKKLPHNIVIINAGMDPLLDDGVKFAFRCKQLGIPVVQKTYELLPHGFLNFALPNIPSAWKAKNEATEFLRKIFEKAEEAKGLSQQ